VKTSKKVKWPKYKQEAVALAVGMMSLSGAVYADDPIKRLLDLQLRKGIITQQEYDEFMSATGEDSPATVETGKEVETGKFRRELYFRIDGVGLHLPPLRDRREDISALLEHFLAKHAAELGRSVPRVSEKEMEHLGAHDWPGNVRELENLARKIAAFGEARKAIEELLEMPRLEQILPEEMPSSSLKVAARAASRRTERDLISKALERTHWNRKRAAQELQISYKSLLYKIKQTGLEIEKAKRG